MQSQTDEIPTSTPRNTADTVPPPPASPTASTRSIECPECAAQVTLARPPLIGEVIRCGDCAVELEVTCTEPVSVEVAPQVEEDWGE